MRGRVRTNSKAGKGRKNDRFKSKTNGEEVGGNEVGWRYDWPHVATRNDKKIAQISSKLEHRKPKILSSPGRVLIGNLPKLN